MSNSQIRTLPRHALRRRLVASSFAALLIVLGGVGHALAQDDDDELPDTKFLKSMLRGFGLRNGEENSGINYQERPPLVVPPTRDLPPPQTADAARLNAQWPIDQDEKRRREAAKRKKQPSTFVWEDLSRQLLPSELHKGAGSPKDEALRKRSGDNIEDAERQYKPSELGYVSGIFGGVKGFFTGNNQAETATFEAEPPRTSLTDPPTGYRSPSPLEPYGVGADHTRPKPVTQEERVTSGAE